MLKRIFDREPVVIIALVEAILLVAAAFGFGLDASQTAAILALVVAVTAFQRNQVTPVADPDTEALLKKAGIEVVVESPLPAGDDIMSPVEEGDHPEPGLD